MTTFPPTIVGPDSDDDAEIEKELNQITNNFVTLDVKKAMFQDRPLSPIATRRWNIPKPDTAIIIAVSSRALFDLTEERTLYEKEGLAKYIEYMIEKENTPLKPGSAFPFIQALACINLKLLELDPQEKNLFDVVLMSNQSAQIGVSLINSINYHKMTIERVCLTAGKSVIGYLSAYNTDLYLSADEDNVVQALNRGIASARLFAGGSTKASQSCSKLKIAFDGDAVLFSDEAEIIAKEHGLEKFFENEAKKANQPLDYGPLHKFAMKIGEIKKKFSDRGIIEDCPIRTYLVTARSAASSGLRALRTLRVWGLDIDEALFLAGAPKGPILEKIKPHLFFDDQTRNVESGLEHGVQSAHVPYGIAQKSTSKTGTG
uniref:Cytosolic 5'-nucleotidase 1A n=1 Tax=Phallusia mammillata TaxID=59560 RepID=A0A6F9DMP6_9ASCI|nr:cytosolic 5'-nucleotidase 1A [Phallusia mammillata]